mmetsp:Transcript_9710/g.21897  ORF Transcript_9710/g.21897 Transcript_9710/m.21897 type:complete len:602 (+) Transcript_9710:28-1833(+)
MGHYAYHMQAGKKRRRSTSLSLVTVLWHHFVGMKSITVAAGPIMFARRSKNAIQGPWCRHMVGQGGGSTTSPLLAFATPAHSTLLTSPSHHASRRVCVRPQMRSKSLSVNPTNRPLATKNFSTLLFLQRDGTVINEENWKSFSDELNETLELPSISVPARHVHWLLSDKHSPVKPYLATRMLELDGVHPKIKVVRDCEQLNEEPCVDKKPQRRKRILLDSHLASGENNIKEHNSSSVGSEGVLLELMQQLPGMPEHILQRLVDDFGVTPGKAERIDVLYQNQPITRILSKVLPPDAQPPPSSYEQIGHVAHLNLRQPHVPHGKLIGRVMIDRLQPSIRTVVNKVGEVGGPYRTYQMDLLAGDDDYFVHVVEHGVSLFFDLRNVYWCTRLEGERTYTIDNEFKPNQLIADAFCGVGALCIRAATAKGCRVLANDLNPDAVAHCKDSASRNGIDISENNGKFQVQCGDASQFIMNLGIDGVSNLPDHLLLNFPLDSASFLNSLRWWPSGESIESPPRVHMYTFARGDEERTPAEVAIDMVAEGLLPEGGYVEPSKFRGEYLDQLGCNVQAREVRDAAPGKLVICVSFSVTRLLLRRMQGDFKA